MPIECELEKEAFRHRMIDALVIPLYRDGVRLIARPAADGAPTHSWDGNLIALAAVGVPPFVRR